MRTHRATPTTRNRVAGVVTRLARCMMTCVTAFHSAVAALCVVEPVVVGAELMCCVVLCG